MTDDKSKFLSLKENKLGSVTFGNDALGKIRGKGLVSLSNGRRKSQDVLFVDGLKHSLLSVSQICDRGCEVTFTAKNCKIKRVNTRELLAKGVRTKNNVYVLKEDKEKCHLRKIDESWSWHIRLGHLNFDHIVNLNNEGVVKDLPKLSKPNNSVCESCQMGNLTCDQFKSKSFTYSKKSLQPVHIDLCGPSQKEGTGREHYFMLVIDDFSRRIWVSFLREQSDVFDKFKTFKALSKNQKGRRLKSILLDRGGEFMSRDFKEFYDRHGIKREYTIPGTSQQNGVVECKNRSVHKMERAKMNERDMSQTF
jgi:hypothetical protein